MDSQTNMNWSIRYAISKMPSRCIFCNGINHFNRTAKDWTQENSEQTGLPRPSVATEPLFSPVGENAKNKWRKRVVIPWSSQPLRVTDNIGTSLVTPESGDKFNAAPAPIFEREQKVRTHGVCAMCGEQFNPNDLAVRFHGFHYTVESDHYPMHPECMRQTVAYCPHMMGYKEDYNKLQSGGSKFFSKGTFKDLSKKSEGQTEYRKTIGRGQLSIEEQ
jgi:hypothetical protein